MRRLGFGFNAVSSHDDLVTVTIKAPKDFGVGKEEEGLGSGKVSVDAFRRIPVIQELLTSFSSRRLDGK